MARRVTQLPTRSKRNTTSRDVLLLSNKDTGKNFQIPITEVFPKLNNGSVAGNTGNTATILPSGTSTQLFVGGGSADSTTGVDNNTLVFRGIRVDVAGSATAPSTVNHNNTTCPLQIFSESTSNSAKGNVLLGWDPTNYDLSNFSNTTSGFLSTVNLASNVTGSLPVANGGTGVTSIGKGSVLLATGTDTLGAVTPSGNGKVLITNQTTGVPAWSTLTAGTNVTIAESAGGITINSSIGTISSTLDTSNNSIDIGTGWLSGDGTNEGININASGKVFIGSGTPGSYFTNDLNVNSSISLGSQTGSDQSISMKPTTSGSTANLTISGSDASGTGLNGGRTTIEAGDGDTNGSGGGLYLKAGRKAGTGTEGNIYLQTGSATSLQIDENNDVTVNSGSLIITSATEGIVHTGSGTVTQATDHTTGVTLNATSGVITLAGVALNAAAEADFTVTNSTVQTDSVILLTVQSPVASTAVDNATLSAQTNDIRNGSFKIRLSNPGAANTSTTAHKIHFLIINNSV
jgi:hypothetical protein